MEKIYSVEDLQSFGERELIELVQSLQRQVPSDEVQTAIQTMVDYSYEDEAKHYSESDEPAGHIFESIKTVAAWIGGVRK